MNRRLVLQKLESLARCVERILSQGAITQEILERDFDIQDIVVLNIERAIQNCVDIGNHILVDCATCGARSMADTFLLLEKIGVLPQKVARSMVSAVGFRNIAVHQYEKLSMAVVSAIINNNLDDFKAFASAIYKYLKDNDNGKKSNKEDKNHSK